MAVGACIKPNYTADDSDDDEGPAFFKRSKTTSRQSQISAEVNRTPTQKNDGSSGNQAAPGSGTPNGQTSSVQKGKVAPPLKASTSKPGLSNSKPSSSAANNPKSGLSNSKPSSSGANNLKQSAGKSSSGREVEKKRPDKSPAPNSKVSSSLPDNSKKLQGKSLGNNDTGKKPVANMKESNSTDNSKPSPGKSLASNDMKNKHSDKHAVEPNSDSEDSDDEKPLSVRRSTASVPSPKNNSNTTKGPTSSGPSSSISEKPKVSVKKISEDSEDEKPLSSKPKVSVKKVLEDSEDEMPLSSKFKMKASGSAPIKRSYESDEEKPFASRNQQNGSMRRDNEPSKSSKVLNKRPLSDSNSLVQSSVKKTKLSEASLSNNVKNASVKAEPKIEEEDDDDDVPIAQRMKKSPASDNKTQSIKKSTKVVSSSLKRTDKKSKKIIKKTKYSKSTKLPPASGEGQKWSTLVHSGVIFPPPYTPHGVKMLYNGQPVDLTPEQEEVATMFAVMKDTDYAAKPKFIENFWNDWRPILGKNHVIKKFELCDFTPIYEWHQREKEKKKQMSTEEKKRIKEEKMKQEEKYMWAEVDGVREKVGNFRVEPPGLFRGRGEHPKMGKLKKRIRPSDITINIGKGAPIPECPIPGERWKEVKHDNTVTWLAFWNDPINPKEFKYVFLAASSALKGQSDKEKYEKARLLKDYIQNIRVNYTRDFVNKDVMKRQIAVATYLIDKLALRAGNEKDDDEADTVGCCTLKVENVTLVPDNKLQFDFLGKDSIRYFNTVEVEPLVYKAIGQFKSGKTEGDDLFDKLDTSKLNAHLKELMPGLTAKVFRTYNASITLDDMLNKGTKGGDVAEKIVVYQHANKEVAIICNHQRSVSKSHSAQMSKLTEKMDELKAVLDELKTDLARAKKGKPPLKDADGKQKKNLTPEALERKIAQTNGKLEKMERDMNTKESLKTVALGTSKINYLDPRISVAWCKRQEVPIEKIFNKSLLAKFAWAMDVDPDFRF